MLLNEWEKLKILNLDFILKFKFYYVFFHCLSLSYKPPVVYSVKPEVPCKCFTLPLSCLGLKLKTLWPS